MNMPENGRVVVIDDQINEALPLLRALSKNNIPAIYFTGKYEELPENKLENIRLVFLDLKIVDTSTDTKINIKAIVSLLSRIISEENGPYIMILWSRHEDDYETDFKNTFDNELKSLRPILILSLIKAQFFQNDESGNLVEVDNCMKFISNKIKEESRKFEAFNLFILWENLVNKSSGEIVNNFSSFYHPDDNWNKNMSGIFHRLAEAYSGKQLNMEDKDELIKNALFTFNSTFVDTLENNIRNEKYAEEIITIENIDKISDQILAKINKKLLLSENYNNSEPGNLYELQNEEVTRIDFKDIFDGNIDQYSEKDDFLNSFKHIILEVSPTCDYAQNKWKLHRILPGLMWPAKHEKKINKTKKGADYICISPDFEIGGNIYMVVFDIRYITSLNLDKLKDRNPLFRIRHEFLVDIQSKIARHINRPGITTL